MADPAPVPDAPPDPPLDLATRTLPTQIIPAGTILYRIHRTAHVPLYFGPRTRSERRGRWDAPDDEFGVCYFSEESHLAFAETLLRDLDLDHIATATLAARALVEVRAVRDLTLVKMHGDGLRRLRATGGVVQGQYGGTRAWSLALHGHPVAPDGIRYHAHHDDDAFAIAVYDRAARALAPGSSVGLLDPRLTRELGSWLDRYRIGFGA